MIYIGSDHRGYKLKEYVKEYLEDRAQDYEDLGADNEEESDYPEFAKKVGEKVSRTDNRGILICGSGAGMTITANKIKGIYAALSTNPEMSKAIKAQDDVNVLVLAANFTSEDEAKKILDSWFSAKFDRKDRHQRRIDQIAEMER